MQFAKNYILLITCTSIFFANNIYAQNYSLNKKISIEAGPEYRNTDFRWSIDGTVNNNYVNYLSELIFKPIKSTGFYIKGTYNVSEKIFVQASFTKLYTFKGRVTDTDYDSSNRTKPVTQLDLSSHKGNMQQINLNASYQFFTNEKMNACIGAGYSFNKDIYYILDDNNSALRSTYLSKWNGPQLLIKGLTDISDKLFFDAGITINYFKYSSQGNWNLVSEFQHPVSFTQDANGFGIDAIAGIGYRFSQKFFLGAYGSFAKWETGMGTDKLYLESGQIPTTNLNGALRKSSGVRASVKYSF